MPTEIVRSETVLYSSLCTDNVTFITDQIGSFNPQCLCVGCTLPPGNELSPYTTCRLPSADARVRDRDRLVMGGLLVTRMP